MKSKAIFIGILLSIISVFSSQAQLNDFPVLKGPYLGQKPPGMTPVIFAQDIISTKHHEHSAPTFSPDGNEVYWSTFLYKKRPQLILFMRKIDGIWTAPEVAFFSILHSNGNPFISPDGRYLFFNSNRPIRKGDSSQSNQDLWFIEKNENGWGIPKHMGFTINTKNDEFSPSVSSKGNIYFSSNRNEPSGKDDIYFATIENNEYSKPQNIGSIINSVLYDDYPYIAPDESYIIFTSSDREDGYGQGDLYISFKKDDNLWTKPINMGEIINSNADDRFPLVSHDGKYLFFVSEKTGNSDVYWADAKIIEELKPKN